MIKLQITTAFFLAFMMLLIIQSRAKVEAGNQNDLIAKAKQTTIEHKLSTRPMECLIYEALDKQHEGKTIVDVREKHDSRCGGDPATSPRVFSVAFDEKTKEIWSDANSLLGQLEKIGNYK